MPVQVLEAEGAKRTLELKSEGRKIQLSNESEGYLIQVKNEALARREKLILEVGEGVGVSDRHVLTWRCRRKERLEPSERKPLLNVRLSCRWRRR